MSEYMLLGIKTKLDLTDAHACFDVQAHRHQNIYF